MVPQFSLAAAFRAYVAEPVLVTLDAAKPKEKVQRFLVMFPDQSGRIYLLEKVPSYLQNEARRKKYFHEQEIMPAVLLTNLPNGLLFVNNQTDNPMLGEDVSLFLSDANSGLGISWLLTWGYITDEIIVANRATQHHVASVGKNKPHESVAKAKGEFDGLMADLRRDTTHALGLPSLTRAAALKPAVPVAAPVDTTDDKTQVVTPQQSKAELIAIAQSKGLTPTKRWTVDRLITEIAKAEQAEVDQAVADATADAADVTVDVPATTVA